MLVTFSILCDSTASVQMNSRTYAFMSLRFFTFHVLLNHKFWDLESLWNSQKQTNSKVNRSKKNSTVPVLSSLCMTMSVHLQKKMLKKIMVFAFWMVFQKKKGFENLQFHCYSCSAHISNSLPEICTPKILSQKQNISYLYFLTISWKGT